MTGYNWRSLAAAGLLLASRAAFSQATAPGGDVPPIVPAPLQSPPTTYSAWVLGLAGLALVLLALAGAKLVMNGLRKSRHHRHRNHNHNHRSSNHH
jgi:hypothetical protein